MRKIRHIKTGIVVDLEYLKEQERSVDYFRGTNTIQNDDDDNSNALVTLNVPYALSELLEYECVDEDTNFSLVELQHIYHLIGTFSSYNDTAKILREKVLNILKQEERRKFYE